MTEAAFGVSPQPSFFLRPRTTAPSHSSTICSWSTSAGGIRELRLQLQPLNHIAGVHHSLAFSDRSSPLSVGLGLLRYRLNQTHFKQQHLYAGVVSSGSKASSVTTVDANQPDLDSGGGGAGDGFGGRSGGGGGGGGGDGDSNSGGSDNNKGEEGSDGDKKKMAMSMSQKFTLGYAALVGVGGVMGYLKSGSQKSLLAGGLSASLLYYVYTELPARPVLASSLGLGISAALLGVMGMRFKRSGKIFPAGVVSLVSLVMTGGYLHGILRSTH